MKEFCSKCAEIEAQIEILTQRHHAEMLCIKQRLEDYKNRCSKLQLENEALALDLAFYNKDINLTPQEDRK